MNRYNYHALQNVHELNFSTSFSRQGIGLQCDKFCFSVFFSIVPEKRSFTLPQIWATNQAIQDSVKANTAERISSEMKFTNEKINWRTATATMRVNLVLGSTDCRALDWQRPRWFRRSRYQTSFLENLNVCWVMAFPFDWNIGNSDSSDKLPTMGMLE